MDLRTGLGTGYAGWEVDISTSHQPLRVTAMQEAAARELVRC